MAILFMDGFDAGLRTIKWNEFNTPTPSTSYGRFGTRGQAAGDSTNRVLTMLPITLTDDTLGYSFACKITSVTNGETFLTNAFGSGASLTWNTSNEIGILNVEQSGTDYFSTTGPLPINQYHWIEAEVFYSDTVGTIKVWVNGVLEIDESALDTIARPTTVAAYLGGTGSTNVGYAYYDDFVVTDGTGSYNNSLPLGDVHVETLFPDGDGATSDLIGSDADSIDNWELVNEDFEPDTADYVGHFTQGKADTYALENLYDSVATTVLGIQVGNYVSKSSSGVKYGRGVVRTASTDYPQTSTVLLESWKNLMDIIEENPNTTSAWTGAQIDSLEAGFEVRDS